MKKNNVSGIIQHFDKKNHKKSDQTSKPRSTTATNGSIVSSKKEKEILIPQEEASVSKSPSKDADMNGLSHGNQFKKKNSIKKEDQEEEENILKNIYDSNPSLEAFLTLNPPVSAQEEIEHKQIMRIKLSPQFYRLYNQCYRNLRTQYFNSETANRDNYLREQVKRIDLRPLRWHRDLDQLNDMINDVIYKISLLRKDLEIFKTELRGFTAKDKYLTEKKVEYQKLDQIYVDLLTEKLQLEEVLENLGKQKNVIYQEMSSSGYQYEEIKEEISVLNPDEKIQVAKIIHIKSVNIYKSIPKIKPKSPLDLSILPEVIDNKTWNELSTKLYQAIFVNNQLITDKFKESRFRQGLKEFVSEENCTAIREQIVKLNQEISLLQAQKLESNLPLKFEISHPSIDELDRIIHRLHSKLQPLNQKREQLINPKVNKDKSTAVSKEGNIYGESIIGIGSININNRRVFGLENDIDRQIHKVEREISEIQREKAYLLKDPEIIKTNLEKHHQILDGKIRTLENQISKIKIQALSDLRLAFLLEWNDSNNYDAEISREVIDCTTDPFESFYSDVRKLERLNKKFYKIYKFNFDQTDFYSQDGQSLQEFMELPNLSETIAILPYLDERGQVSKEIYQGIISPRKPMTVLEPKLPIIKFVENQQLQVAWHSYALSTLCNSINLLPEEERQLVVEHQTKLNKRKEDARRTGKETKQSNSSSFEDNLRNEFSTAINKSQSEEHGHKSDRSSNTVDRHSTQNSSESNEQSANSASIEMKMSVSASIPFFSASASLKGSLSHSHQSSNMNKSVQSNSKESALAFSSSEQGQTLNKQCRDTSAKNMQNAIQKVANQTSSDNKVEVNLSSVEQSDEISSNKTTMKFKNPNVGRTVNFNFFQLQNVYKTRVKLKDCKIIVNTGIELVEGSGIYDTRIYDVEEFNKIYKNSNNTDLEVIFCALLVRKVLKYYTNLFKLDSNNEGVLQIIPADWNTTVDLTKIKDIYQRLHLAILSTENAIDNNKILAMKTKSLVKDSKGEDFGGVLSEKMREMRCALEAIRKVNFIFNEKQVMDETEFTVNSPAYHVDAQLGFMSVPEPFYEKSRNLDLQMQEGKLSMQHAKIEQERAITENIRALTSRKQPYIRPFFSQETYKEKLTAHPSDLKGEEVKYSSSSR